MKQLTTVSDRSFASLLSTSGAIENDPRWPVKVVKTIFVMPPDFFINWISGAGSKAAGLVLWNWMNIPRKHSQFCTDDFGEPAKLH